MYRTVSSRHHSAIPSCSEASSPAPHEQAPVHRRARSRRVREELALRPFEGDGGERAGEVERDLWLDNHPGRLRLHRVQPFTGGHQQYLSRDGVRDPGDRAGRPGALVRHAGGGGERHSEHRDTPAGGERGEQIGDRATPCVEPEEHLGRHHRTGQVRRGCDAAPQFLQHDGSLAVRGALAAELLGDEQPGRAHLRGERGPQLRVVRRAGLRSGQQGRRVAAVYEQGPDGGAQVVLGLRVEQIGHRARSFQAASLSVRGSEGSPSTRSATMFSSTSLVPPSMELPLERR